MWLWSSAIHINKNISTSWRWIFQQSKPKIYKTNKNLVYYGHVCGTSVACYIVTSIWANFRVKLNGFWNFQHKNMQWYCNNSTCNYVTISSNVLGSSWWSWFTHVLPIFSLVKNLANYSNIGSRQNYFLSCP